VQIDGGGLLIAEPITSLSGTGIGGAGALRNLANNNTWSGAITLGAGASITSDVDTLTLSAALGGGGNALTFGGAGNITESAIISGVGTALTKNGTGTLTLSGANTYTGATAINAGTLQVGAGGATGQLGTGNITNDAALVFNRTAVLTVANAISGAGTLTQNGTGTITLTGTNTYSGATYVNNGLTLSGATGTATSTAFTLNQGGILTLDNSGVIGNNNNDRIANTLTMNGGQIAVIGNANINTTESLDTLNLASGYSTVTLSPNAARNVRLSFTDMSRSAGALVLFRGTNLGVNTVASQTANNSNIEFTTTPPGLVGAGNSGANTVGIIPGAIGAISNASAGTDFVTYNPPTGALNGVRILAAGEYLNGTNVIGPAVGVNYRLTANRTADDTVAVNSLLLNGFTYNYDSTALSAANTLTVTSGNILSVGAANTITTTVAGNASPVDFGATEGKIFTVTNLSLNGSTTSALTGTAGVTKGGAAATLWTQTSPTLFTSGITVAGGTLTLGANNVIADTNPVTVNAGATFNPAGFSDTIGALTLFSGTTGASVTTGAGTLTLGGNLALNVNGAGSAAATITGNLGLGATRTFTVNDGSAASDLSIAAIVSGVGFGLNKAGAGTLTLTGANTFSGGATIQAGTLSGTVAGAFGTGTITIGDSIGSNNATLNGAGAVTFANAISVQSGNTGVATITDTANSTFSGLVTLNHDLTLQTAANTLTFTGATSGFAGTGNLTLNATEKGSRPPFPRKK
jgi:autotransporter-associated beta strand protein